MADSISQAPIVYRLVDATLIGNFSNDFFYCVIETWKTALIVFLGHEGLKKLRY